MNVGIDCGYPKGGWTISAGVNLDELKESLVEGCALKKLIEQAETLNPKFVLFTSSAHFITKSDPS